MGVDTSAGKRNLFVFFVLKTRPHGAKMINEFAEHERTKGARSTEQVHLPLLEEATRNYEKSKEGRLLIRTPWTCLRFSDKSIPVIIVGSSMARATFHSVILLQDRISRHNTRLVLELAIRTRQAMLCHLSIAPRTSHLRTFLKYFQCRRSLQLRRLQRRTHDNGC